MSAARRIAGARREIALHALREGDGDGTALLAIPELAGTLRDAASFARWSGPVHALDPAGHGEADWLVGAGYSPEGIAADADLALEQLGEAVLVGAGAGGYAALLLAGARPTQVPAVVLLPGLGLDGAGSAPSPDPEAVRGTEEAASMLELGASRRREPGRPDPLLRACTTDLRPLDYVEPFARAARSVFLVEDAGGRPEWWAHLRAFTRVVAHLDDALDAISFEVPGA